MDLPVMPPVKPMLAKASRELPEGDFLYEPKWDGFRALVFRDGDEVEITSRNTKTLTRYFPELLGPLREQLPQRCVIDGELVVPGMDGLDFDLLGQRIHPAESRIERLATETPAHLVIFDVLALESTDLRPVPLAERRGSLESLLGEVVPPLHLTPATTDHTLASEWFERFDGGGFDGVMAKPTAGTYEEDRRTQTKVKHHRTVECVVAGYAEHRNGGVGSLKLGLYDSGAGDPIASGDTSGAPLLHHVGVASAFSTAQRRTLVGELEPLRQNVGDDHPWSAALSNDSADGTDGRAARMPGSPNRWSGGRRSANWIPLRPERVVEVTCENVSSHRFRHPARFVRWRPDKDPSTCSIDQLETLTPPEFESLFGG
jgi:ATP-dependent DNA ligase